MKLILDYTQRLNLHALIGAQRANVDEMRAFWRLQDMIELTDEEKRVINYRVITSGSAAGQVQWDVGKELPVREYELPDGDFERVVKVVKEWQPGFLTGADRYWMEPLMAQLHLDGSLNGASATKKETGLGMAMPRGR